MKKIFFIFIFLSEIALAQYSQLGKEYSYSPFSFRDYTLYFPRGELVYVSGDFDTYDGEQLSSNLIRVFANGKRDLRFNSEVTVLLDAAYAKGFCVDRNGKILVAEPIGADLNFPDEIKIRRLLSNGSIDTSFPAISLKVSFGPVVSVYEMFQSEYTDDYYIGGRFDIVNGSTIGGIIRVNQNGQVNENFNIGTGLGNSFGGYSSGRFYAAYSIVEFNQGSNIMVSGVDFNTLNGAALNSSNPTQGDVVSLNYNGSLDSNFEVFGFDISTRSTRSDLAYYTQKIETANKLSFFVTAKGLTTYRGTSVSPTRYANVTFDYPSGNVSTNFGIFIAGPTPSSYLTTIDSVQLDDEKYLFSGYFSSYDGTPVNNENFVVLNLDGTMDTSTYLFPTNIISTGLSAFLEKQSDGKIITFPYTFDSSVTNLTRNRIIPTSGEIDSLFDEFKNRFNGLIHSIVFKEN